MLIMKNDRSEVLKNPDGSPIVIPKTDGGQDFDHVEGHLFTPHGKWKYRVYLDYTGIWQNLVNGPEYDQLVAPTGHKREYIDPDEAAWAALEQATKDGTSEVIISRSDYYTLFVPDPPNGWPIMALSKQVTVNDS